MNRTNGEFSDKLPGQRMHPKIRLKPPIQPKRQPNGNGTNQENACHGRPIARIRRDEIKPIFAAQAGRRSNTPATPLQHPHKNMAAPASRAAAKQG